MSEELTYTNEVNEAEESHSSVERCLTFESGGLVLFLSTNYVIEIINEHTITPLPLVPSYIKGIINLRGQMLPIVDIRTRMVDIRTRMGKPEAEYTSKTCIVVLDVDSVPFGIIVDSVRQVMDIDLQYVRPIPIKRQQELLNGMVTLEDGSVLMSFDCRALSVH